VHLPPARALNAPSTAALLLAQPWLCLPADTIDREQRDNTGFQDIPYYFMEITCVLFKRDVRSCFGSDFQQVGCVLHLLPAGA